MIKFQSIKSDVDLLPKIFNVVAALVALLLIVFSFLGKWFKFPMYVVETHTFYTIDSEITLCFKLAQLLLFLIFGIGTVLFYKRGGGWMKPVLLWAICGFVSTLWYPSVLTHRDSEVMGDAAWLQQQFDTMTWLGGDVYRAHSERSVELGTGVNAQDPPDRLAVFKPPVGSMGWTQINDWMWWFGYGPSFTQFVGSSWFFAVCGYLLVGLSVLGFSWRKSEVAARHLFKLSVICGSCLLLSLASVTVLSVKVAHWELSAAKAAISESDYAGARRCIEAACVVMPTIRCDSGVIRQLGYCDVMDDNNGSVDSHFFQIHRLERHGHYDRARSMLDSLAAQSGELPRYQSREVSRQQLRVAINNINSGRYSRAIHYLDSVISNEQNCLQAQFHRQLMSLQTGDLAMNQKMNQSIEDVIQGVRSKTKRGVIAASAWMRAQGELNSGNVSEAWRARRQSQGK
ncbi:hypothetical protein ACFPK9_13095 [Rubritalea spongiae]|uniref:Tetratricopeptide repeat protein n=1 Tax=Rubritalea spongiae TaxID=430797 RepID=A0ABW5E3A4_9BACT